MKNGSRIHTKSSLNSEKARLGLQLSVECVSLKHKKFLLATRTWTFRVSHASAPGLEFKSDFQHLLLRDKSFVSLATYLVRTPAKFSEFLEPYVTESNQT